ncbi:MAG: hypothetical protein Q4E89_10365, partial [Eubacteriales bacterium]|nr:hypothetical protein [Eubacteriales bacterium]
TVRYVVWKGRVKSPLSDFMLADCTSLKSLSLDNFVTGYVHKDMLSLLKPSDAQYIKFCFLGGLRS